VVETGRAVTVSIAPTARADPTLGVMTSRPSESSGNDGGATVRDDRDRRAASQAVERWARFPVDSDPRPIVLLHSATRPEAGFATGDAKMAFLRGYVEVDDDVPEEPIRLMRSSQMAGGRLPRRALHVTAATLAVADFATDRGLQTLPAWRVDAADTLGPIWVLTQDTFRRCWWPRALRDDEQSGPHLLAKGTPDPDGQALRVEFVGGSEALFYYDVEIIETSTAVTVVPLRRLIRKLPPGTSIKLDGHIREVHVRLTRPLGGRVLVNLDGAPVAVTPPGSHEQ
jgi:hypothetical protein